MFKLLNRKLKHEQFQVIFTSLINFFSLTVKGELAVFFVVKEW